MFEGFKVRKDCNKRPRTTPRNPQDEPTTSKRLWNSPPTRLWRVASRSFWL